MHFVKEPEIVAWKGKIRGSKRGSSEELELDLIEVSSSYYLIFKLSPLPHILIAKSYEELELDLIEVVKEDECPHILVLALTSKYPHIPISSYPHIPTSSYVVILIFSYLHIRISSHPHIPSHPYLT